MKPEISYDDFDKIDMRVAEIKDVEDVEGADKLLKLTLDVGEGVGQRVVCAGIKKYYSKDDLIGKKIILLVNLKPRTLKGIESQGMVLASVNEDKSEVVLIEPEQGKDAEVGSRVS